MSRAKFCSNFCGTCPACREAMGEVDELDRIYASADFEGEPVPDGEEIYDEMEELRKAGLSRGQP